jgi:peroxiredoxin
MGQAFLWAIAGLSLAGLVGLSVVVYELLRQQGRLVLRLERIEALAAGAVQHGAPEMPAGLEVGAAVDPFELPDLGGELVSLEDFRGKRVLLVNWSPACGYCTQIASELAELESKLRKRNTELLFVSQGGAEANRKLADEHGLSAPILLQEKPIAAFEGMGTPVGYLVDEQGRVAAPLGYGAEQVPELARAAAEGRKRLASERSLAESRIERDGLQAGTKAPEFELPDVRGTTVALSDYRGRMLLLVFSDPSCGPCNALLPDLARFQDEGTIVMVSRGEPAENLAKVEEHGLQFPVLVQDGWKLSKQYGIFATPVAFLIDEQGVIATDVAKGREEIMALALRAAGKEAPVLH